MPAKAGIHSAVSNRLLDSRLHVYGLLPNCKAEFVDDRDRLHAYIRSLDEHFVALTSM
jgi:hypothetical protein